MPSKAALEQSPWPEGVELEAGDVLADGWGRALLNHIALLKLCPSSKAIQPWRQRFDVLVQDRYLYLSIYCLRLRAKEGGSTSTQAKLTSLLQLKLTLVRGEDPANRFGRNCRI
jgi:hypothetical protein